MPLDATATARDALSADTTCDVLVIGGGPSGSTAAAILAAAGRSVVILEKAEHPRFHIGESLLPQNLRQLERLGLREAVAGIGVFKPGACFVSDEHNEDGRAGGRQEPFFFDRAMDGRYGHAYQVRRSEYDEMLFREAARRGADAREGVRVIAVRTAPDAEGRAHVLAEGPDGGRHGFRPRFVLDASGRDTFLAAQDAVASGTPGGGKNRNGRNNTAAMYAHFRGVAPRGGPGHDDDGCIAIHLFAHGWFWFIPLRDGITSIGVVSNAEFFRRRRGSVDEFLRQCVASCPSAEIRMEHAEQVGEAHSTGNYSYDSGPMRGANWAKVGDAFAFLDPVFSSGVLLAMASAELAADAIHVWLDDPRRAEPMLRRFERKVRGAVGALSWLIYRINDPTMRDMFMNPSDRFRMRTGIVTLLAGDVHRNPNRQLPVIAFKAHWYALSALRRLCGLRLRRGTLARA